MQSFNDYWDTRIEANQRLFDANPGVANFAYSEVLAFYEYAEGEIAKLQKELDDLKANNW